MRKQLWSAVVSGWALSLLCAGVTHAQLPPAGGGGHYEAAMGGPATEGPYQPNPGYQPIAPTQYTQPGGQMPPAFQPYPYGQESYQAQLPMPPLNPYPATSPYDHAFDQHFNEDGLWFRRTKDGRQSYYGYLDFWGANLKGPDPSAQIGEPVQSVTSAWEAVHALEFRILENSVANLLISSFDDLDARDSLNKPVRLSQFNPDLRRLGLRVNFGVINPDYTGAEVAGFWIVPREVGNSFADGSIERSPDPAVPTTIPSITPELDPTLVPNSGRLSFNEGLQVTYTNTAWGAEFNLFGMTPLNKDESMFLRGIFGVRYYGTDSQMSIYGQNGDLIGELTLIQVFDDEEFIIYSNPDYNWSPRHNFLLESQVQSHLIGPQIGLQPELGGKEFKITAWAKFAPMANIESASIKSENYGLPFTDGPKTAQASARGVHYSSLVQVGGLVQAPVFKYVPWLRNIPVLKTGTLRIGYDWIYVTDIGRAEKSVRYYSPLPKLEVNRTEQTLKGWFGGVGFTW